MGLLMHGTDYDKGDPRWLRAMMDRSAELAREHGVGSVFVGVAGHEGDLLVADFLAFVESALRVEDSIFPISRERAVLLLTDVDLEQAREILARLSRDFGVRYPSASPPLLEVKMHLVEAGRDIPTVKEVLPGLFNRIPEV